MGLRLAKAGDRSGWRATLASELAAGDEVVDLFERVLLRTDFSRKLSRRLIDVARGPGGSWQARCVAALMLELQVAKISPDAVEDFDFILLELGLKREAGIDQPVNASVLAEGYTSTSLPAFARELRRHLGRSAWIHDPPGPEFPGRALRELVRFSRRECRLALARYLFSPEEVVARVLEQVAVSDGEPYPERKGFDVRHEAQRLERELPPYEAAICRGLCRAAGVFWVSDAVGSRINALVEYPLTTVVLVVKPPGSRLELELKRAGRRGPRPLTAVFERDGEKVPASHRLDGGSSVWNLHFEGKAAASFAAIYRAVHGVRAPVPSTISIVSIRGVPTPGGEVGLRDYFTDAGAFGPGFDEMRQALRKSIPEFESEYDAESQDLADDESATRWFLHWTFPGQAILAGTSSFRLDQLAALLSPDDAGAGDAPPGVAPPPDADSRVADELLEEVLGVYRPPPAPPSDYAGYLTAAYAVPENRSRADDTYRRLMSRLGRFWGTLLGVRGYSKGESLVARNLGLRSVWSVGRWIVRLHFMDHDSLFLPPGDVKFFHPWEALRGMRQDEMHLFGHSPGQGTVDHLAAIYRVDPEVRSAGLQRLRREAWAAYRKTQRAMLEDRALHALLGEPFCLRVRHFDQLVDDYLRIRRDPSAVAAWEGEARERLAAWGYGERLIDHTVWSIQHREKFLERLAFLRSAESPE